MTTTTDGAPYPPLTGREPCRSEPDLFFPLDTGRAKEVARAKEMCGWCHAQQGCLAYALTHAVNGIWGGATEAERRKMQRKDHVAVVPMVLRADVDLMVRAARRGTPVPVIAALTGIGTASVAHALRDRREQEAAAQGEAVQEVAQ
jgi:WhiB family redox-sensing transcriptional regulator